MGSVVDVSLDLEDRWDGEGISFKGLSAILGRALIMAIPTLFTNLCATSLIAVKAWCVLIGDINSHLPVAHTPAQETPRLYPQELTGGQHSDQCGESACTVGRVRGLLLLYMGTYQAQPPFSSAFAHLFSGNLHHCRRRIFPQYCRHRDQGGPNPSSSQSYARYCPRPNPNDVDMTSLGDISLYHRLSSVSSKDSL